MANNKGTVIQVVGPVLDIRFADGCLPDLLNAIEVTLDGNVIVAEVAQHIGDNVARCIAMSSTDGLQRGAEAVDTGAAIAVPVGEDCLAASSTCWVSPSMRSPTWLLRKDGPSIVPLPPTRISRAQPRSWKPASRSST